ncbi:hypothetical protein JI57_04135 [Psychromonas sp. PRT-SC03]|nr:hypothetical protein JI57_04135 [Psychromonas sp. PRT-SC03]
MNNQQYFLVDYALAINVQALTEDEDIPDAALFEQLIPAPFKMASELANIDSNTLHSLKLNNERTQALWQYIQAQDKKINALLSYVLSQQDDAQYHYKSSAFSAGHCIFHCAKESFSIGQSVVLKIFIPDESAAIFCYANVTEIEAKSVTLEYLQIREIDRELLIRSTLHIQSKQLKLRATIRDQDH